MKQLPPVYACLDFLAKHLPNFDKVHVLDIGANPLGRNAVYKPLLDMKLAQVVGFEPQKEAYERLIAQSSDVTRFIRAAVGDGKKHTLHIFKAEGLTSLLRLREDLPSVLRLGGGRLLEEVEIETKALSSFEGEIEVDFLKIDTQGAELMILQNAGHVLDETLVIQIELRTLPSYQGEPSLAEVWHWLESNSYQMHNIVDSNSSFMNKTREFHRNSEGKIQLWRQSQLVDIDGFFVRNLMFTLMRN